MRKKGFGRIGIYLLLAVLLGWPVYQLSDWYASRKQSGEADFLLYQVTLFQMQMLSGALADSVKQSDSAQFKTVQQAAYAAQYAHERLAASLAEHHPAELTSLAQLMQYMMRLQVGGPRKLTAEEARTLQELNRLYRELSETYGKLMGGSRKVIGSQNEKLAKTDRDIFELLRKKQLE